MRFNGVLLNKKWTSLFYSAIEELENKGMITLDHDSATDDHICTVTKKSIRERHNYIKIPFDFRVVIENDVLTLSDHSKRINRQMIIEQDAFQKKLDIKA